jgi:hypothetical protein
MSAAGQLPCHTRIEAPRVRRCIEMSRHMSDSENPSYWIIVGSLGNFEKSRELGFTVQGMKSRHRKKAERMKPGDKIAYYITGRKAFAAISTIASPYFESHDPIWKSADPKKDAEDYPFRVETTLDVALPDSEFVDAEPIARQMEYASKWPAANWTLAFQGNVHEINASDFALIRDAIDARVATLAV